MSRDRHNIMKIELIFKAHKTKENNRVARHLSPSGKPAVGEARHSDPLNKSFLLSMKLTVDHISLLCPKLLLLMLLAQDPVVS